MTVDVRVDIRWRSSAEGGRRSGPPKGPEYFATCRFPGDSEHHSIKLILGDNGLTGTIEFFSRFEVDERLEVDTSLDIMEGPRLVAVATVLEVIPYSR